eukprot:8364999-Karenia_brevis.AAC.1
MELQPSIHILQANLLRGGPRGAPQMLLSETARGQPRFRYLTANIFKKYIRSRPGNVYLEEEIEGVKTFVFPLFNIDDFDREKMLIYRNVILADNTLAGVENALRSLNILTHKFYWRRFCAWWQRYTLVTVHEGRFNESAAFA